MRYHNAINSKGGHRLAQLLVRDVEPVVVERLKKRARQHGRSLEAEVRLILSRAAGQPLTELPPEVKRIRALFKGRKFSDSADLLREDRDR
jgi:antitoxin FitA